MDRSEAMKIVGLLEGSYRGQPSPPERIEVYVNRLLDLDYDAAMLGAMTLVETSKFYPSIAELREAATVGLTTDLPDPDAAWQMVSAVIHGAPRAELPPVVRELVESMGVHDLRTSTNPMADRAHFLRMYEAKRRRAAQDRQLSPEVRELTATLAAKLSLPARVAQPQPPPPEEQHAALDRVEREQWLAPRRELAARIAQVPETMDRDEQLRRLKAIMEAEDDAARAEGRCCHLHTRTCEPPSELCCDGCTEVDHPVHADGRPCVLGFRTVPEGGPS